MKNQRIRTFIKTRLHTPKLEEIRYYHYFSKKLKTMQLLLSTLFMSCVFTISAQNLQFTDALQGTFENKKYEEKLIIKSGGDGETEKEQLFAANYENRKTETKTFVFREIKGSQLGEWYSGNNGKVYIRFIKNRVGEVIAELGKDKNYDQVIDTYRRFKFEEDFEGSQLKVYEGPTNEERVSGAGEGMDAEAKCDAEKAKLEEYFIESEEATVYEHNNERLYVVSQVYGSHETMKGVLVELEGEEGNYTITHKVDIWYQPNKNDYGCAFQIFNCKGKRKLERYSVLVNEDKSIITLNGDGFKKVE